MSTGGKKNNNPDPNRRSVIIGGAAAIAGLAAGIVIGGSAFPKLEEKTQVQTVVKEKPIVSTKTVTQTVTKVVPTELQYQKQKVANISQLPSAGTSVITTYMGYPVIIMRTGVKSIGGVGPSSDIVGFSNVCAHMGYQPIVYNSNTNCLVCPQHFSQYDVTVGGMPVIGHPNEYLPQLYLEYDESTGDIYGLGFNRLVYGVYNNVLQAPSSSSSSSGSS
ncbi:Rieske 2Fe-2S domain-containing protein [Acidianus sp. RZ1]|uniref:Rieske 2Fe-2S domain-containing protein n=1 Tax=Acidianus sp. RZ1 TaxID=1540082 RepID=UPI001492B4F9|nr:Rieske 2Fe-2S domain-containing protein [Acidianus sp. RZ1]NON62652.1 Rieske 2Fe-2S domain-containing protein [Acidianus sp. RZ1]